jgi:hypothetical protein
MPRRSEPAVAAESARLRSLQKRLPEMSVPALLRIRATLEPLLAGDRIRVADVDAVVRAAEGD